MATKSYADAGDMLSPPAARPSLFDYIATFVSAVGEARNAEYAYRQHVARGCDPTEAARRAFDENFGRR